MWQYSPQIMALTKAKHELKQLHMKQNIYIPHRWYIKLKTKVKTNKSKKNQAFLELYKISFSVTMAY